MTNLRHAAAAQLWASSRPLCALRRHRASTDKIAACGVRAAPASITAVSAVTALFASSYPFLLVTL